MSSAQRIAFEKAAAAGDWQNAFSNLNSLSMSEMLGSLSALSKLTLDNLIQRRFAYKVGVNMPRMEYAWTVVRSRSFPLVAPGDLVKTGQVIAAGQFLKKAIPAKPRVTLNLMVFSDSIVTNRTLFGELKEKAEKILKDQGNGFKLDLSVHSKDIPLQELVYLQSQLEDMVKLAEKQTTIPSDRLVVLQVRAKSNINVYGMAPKVNGRRLVAIDTDQANPDRATLLHEIGHCAGLPHAGESPAGKGVPVDVGGERNVMNESKSSVYRETLSVTQGEFLAKAYFATDK